MPKFQLDNQELESLIKAMKLVPENTERVANDYFKNIGSKKAMLEIIELIPVGEGKGPHAHDGKPLKAIYFNLGFSVTRKRAFDYLAYPNYGIGPRNPREQLFFELGLESVSGALTEEITQRLIEAAAPKI
ncbi:hypothetical protein [Vaginisenegalia massiliensis]|uniref:hypothetical protein n=1 Tax=Vaginisenegalia massiliensis TaxID=2058294 RepID=UPI000F52EDBD|nr:hypothetical protein [Vaginisenegalia massiliensis]